MISGKNAKKAGKKLVNSPIMKTRDCYFNTSTPVILLVLPILMVFKEREFIISHKTRTILIYYIR